MTKNSTFQSPAPTRLLASAVASLALVAGIAFTPVAEAVPCGHFYTGGVAPSTSCRNGADGDTADSAADLNGGSYFGINSWNLLDNTGDGVDNSAWTFWNLSGSVNPNGTRLGIIELASGIWQQYSSLTVVLNGRGGATDKDVKWAAYLINPGDHWLAWSYDFIHRLGNASLYGTSRDHPPTSVPEPAALAVLLAGLGLGALVLRRRLKV